MKKLIILVLLFQYSTGIFAQEVLFDKKNFKEQKDQFKVANNHFKEATELMETLPFPKYKQALEHYLKAQEFNPKSTLVNYNIGLCYLHSTQKFKALDYFQNALQLNPTKFKKINYYIGRGFHLNMEWDQAIRAYQSYQSRLIPSENAKDLKDVQKKIAECKYGKKLEQAPVRAWIDNMGKTINTTYPEYGLIMTADASQIFFTGRRPNTTGGEKDYLDDNYFEDIYTSNRFTSDNWSSPVNIGAPINTKGHDATVALSPDGKKMIIYIDDKGDGNLYETVWDGTTWSKPKAFEKPIYSPYHEPSAWYTPDMKELYFVSNRPYVKGDLPKDQDIFIATWNDEKEAWENAVRLPKNINSPYDEGAIYLHPDGKTIYFSSKGHNSMGGYDVFKSVRTGKNTWSEPVNMGYPINTPDDDVFFVVAANGRDAYMTSYRKKGVGEKDIYKVTLLGPEKEPIVISEQKLLANAKLAQPVIEVGEKVKVTGSQLTILKGVVSDEETKQPLKANIELVDNETKEIIAEFSSDAKSGRYLVSLPGGKNYGIAVKTAGYLFHSENFDVKKSDGYKEVVKNIALKKINVGKSIVLRNIFFDFDKATLRPESVVELERLKKFLVDNATIKVEISGYTDSRGSASYNQSLSERRAKSVVDYLIEKGITASRLTYKGYGPKNPIVSDAEIAKMVRKSDIEAAHQQNRRTEFKIIAK